MGSGQSNFYATFSPRTVDADDLLDQCSEMLQDLVDGCEPPPPNWYCCSCDGCDFEVDTECVSEDEAGECEHARDQQRDAHDKHESLRRDALSACIDARADVQSNESKVAQTYHECRQLFNTWRHMYD